MTEADFEFTIHPYRVVFGPGRLEQVAYEVARLGRSRALVLASPGLAAAGDAAEAPAGAGVREFPAEAAAAHPTER